MLASFQNDYNVGAHPAVLSALAESNLIRTAGYGEDHFCRRAAETICRLAGQPCCVFFFTGGTQTNLTAISHLLRPYEAVIASGIGHIATHETGAIGATGHKVITLPCPDGKLCPEQIAAALLDHMPPHTVNTRMIYLSQPTEIGTLYSKEELTGLAAFCREHNLLLYIDGARLASALAAQTGHLELSDYAGLADVFYIGGTKCGALFGEALVLTDNALADSLCSSMKQRGALLAKGRLLGIQFEALLKDGLYIRLGAHANAMAALAQEGLSAMGVSFSPQTITNQLFPIFSNQMAEALCREFSATPWGWPDTRHTVIRLVTSWATTEQEVDELLASVKRLQC